MPQGVIDKLGGNSDERIVKPSGTLSRNLDRVSDCLVGRRQSGNEIMCEGL